MFVLLGFLLLLFPHFLYFITLFANHSRLALSYLFFSHSNNSLHRHGKNYIFLSYPPHLDQSVTIIPKTAQHRTNFIVLIL